MTGARNGVEHDHGQWFSARASHLVTKLFIGTSTQPLDLDSLSVKVNAEFVSIPRHSMKSGTTMPDHSGNAIHKSTAMQTTRSFRKASSSPR